MKRALASLVLFMASCGNPDAQPEVEVKTSYEIDPAPCAQYESKFGLHDVGKELIIRDLSVVEDACRTKWSVACAGQGRWTAWYLFTQMQAMADPRHLPPQNATPDTADPSYFILKWLEQFEESHTVGPQNMACMPRTGIRTLVIDPWLRASGCQPGFTADQQPGCRLRRDLAPFRLLAIVYRPDLRATGNVNNGAGYNNASTDVAGEGRLVFGFTAPDGTALDATVIFEYVLPTKSRSTLQWAQAWAALGTKPFGSSYNDDLQLITDGFVRANTRLLPQNTIPNNNGSSLNHVRIQEIAFFEPPLNNPGATDPMWTLREMGFGCLDGGVCAQDTRYLVFQPMTQTPDNYFTKTDELTAWMNANSTNILNETYEVPLKIGGDGRFRLQGFRGCESKSNPISNQGFYWTFSKALNDQVAQFDIRRRFAFNTCNGCHYFETRTTDNFHIAPRAAGQIARLSGFLDLGVQNLQGWKVTDLSEPRLTREHIYNEPRRRMCEMLHVLAGNSKPLYASTGVAAH